MHFSTVLASAVALASTAFASPAWSSCLSPSTAQSIVDQYITILSHSDIQAANATAQTLLAPDYQEISDSILSLEGLPLGEVTFSGRDSYINGVLNAPPVTGIDTLQVLVAGCDQILWQWIIFGIGTMQYEVKGFNLFALNDAGQIQTVHLEFNSIAWGLDTGYQLIFPNTPPPGRK